MAFSKHSGKFGTGWIPDVPDRRDKLLKVSRPAGSIPDRVSLMRLCPPIVDQGKLGSCTGNATAAALACLMKKDRGDDSPAFSRLFLYYHGRAQEGSINDDAGAMIRDVVRVCVELGCCFEINWPYDIAKFAEKPEFGCYAQAGQFQVTSYHRVDSNSLTDLMGCLAEGYPFVGGITLYESFESDDVEKTGIVPMPGSREKSIGGHAVCFVGYDKFRHAFLVRNSWGTDWGMDGYFWLPFEYIDLLDDCWTLRAGENL